MGSGLAASMGLDVLEAALHCEERAGGQVGWELLDVRGHDVENLNRNFQGLN